MNILQIFSNEIYRRPETPMAYRNLLLTCVALLGFSAVRAETPALEKEASVKAPLADVWHAWTTAGGLAFISEKSNVELRIGGPYEWFLDLEPDARGKRGGEGSQILAFLPLKMLAFSWTFPPSIPELRDADERTQVVVLFDECDDGVVQVRLYAHGWQDGEPWQRGRAYFDKAWGAVLGAMKKHFESGDQEWGHS